MIAVLRHKKTVHCIFSVVILLTIEAEVRKNIIFLTLAIFVTRDAAKNSCWNEWWGKFERESDSSWVDRHFTARSTRRTSKSESDITKKKCLAAAISLDLIIRQTRGKLLRLENLCHIFHINCSPLYSLSLLITQLILSHISWLYLPFHSRACRHIHFSTLMKSLKGTFAWKYIILGVMWKPESDGGEWIDEISSWFFLSRFLVVLVVVAASKFNHDKTFHLVSLVGGCVLPLNPTTFLNSYRRRKFSIKNS